MKLAKKDIPSKRFGMSDSRQNILTYSNLTLLLTAIKTHKAELGMSLESVPSTAKALGFISQSYQST